MKKKLIIGIVLMLVLTALPLSVNADPLSVDLLAGQDTDVGDITVWNDGDNLYVEFDTTDSGELMLETHLAVATSLSDIPQTKKGNPIPGQFEYNTNHPGGTLTYVYTIPLDWIAGTQLYLAAHASLGQELTMTLFSGVDQGIMVYGPLSAYAPINDVTWGTPVPAVATYVHPSWPAIAGATWISNTYYIGEPIAASSWRWFNHEFTVPGYPLSGSITVTADNAEDIYLNTVFVGSDGEVQDPWVDNHEWNTVLTHPMYPIEGLNDLDIIVRNYPGSSDPYANPTGLIYTMEINYIESGESAWGDGCDFPGANWATYFTYEVQGWWELVDTIYVYAANTNPVSTNVALENGGLYKFVASGTCNWRVPGHVNGYLADSSYWLRHDSYGEGWTDQYSLAMWDGNFVNIPWVNPDTGLVEFNSAHIYEYEYTATSTDYMQFIFTDDVYSDNSGYLTINIYEWA